MIHLKANGQAETTMPTKDNLNVFPVNNIFHSLFRQVNLSLNNQQVAQNTYNYAYRSYVENLLNFDVIHLQFLY